MAAKREKGGARKQVQPSARAVERVKNSPVVVQTIVAEEVASTDISTGRGVSPVEVSAEDFDRGTKISATLCLLLAIMTFSIYFRATSNPFVNYDDQGYVVENEHLKKGLTAETMRWALTSTEETNWHPLTWISHAVDIQLFGMNPTGHHLTSVLLHILNTILLFLLLARATGEKGRSFFVAALFALHPINVESVAWIAERKNVLCMFFILLTIAAYGWYAQQPKVGRYLAVVGAFALALAAKPMAVTLPFVFLLLDYWPLQRLASLAPSEVFVVPQRSFWQLVEEKLPLLVLSGISVAVTLVAQRPAVHANQTLPPLPRFINAVYAYSAYLGKAFRPIYLAPFYPYQGFRLPSWQFFLSAAFLAGVSIWVWKNRSRRYLPVGWCWFLGTLVPMIGLVQVGDQAMADRYAYLSLIGIFIMTVWSTVDVAEKRHFSLRWCVAGGAVILVALSLLTWRQIGFWRSSRDLWFHALAVTKDNYMAEDYVGSALLLDNYNATGQRRLDEAMVHFRNAARINPNDAIAHLNLGADLHERGQLQEAIEEYQKVLTLTRDAHFLAKSYIDLGAAAQQLGNFDQAKQYYRMAEEYEPESEALRLNRERLEAQNPKAAAEHESVEADLMQRGKSAMAKRIQALAASASAKPSPAAYLELGHLQEVAGQVAEARRSYETAIKLDPNLTEAQSALKGINGVGDPHVVRGIMMP